MAVPLLYFSSVIVLALLAGTNEAAPKPSAPRLRRKFSTPAAAITTEYATKGCATRNGVSSSTSSFVATNENAVIFASAKPHFQALSDMQKDDLHAICMSLESRQRPEEQASKQQDIVYSTSDDVSFGPRERERTSSDISSWSTNADVAVPSTEATTSINTPSSFHSAPTITTPSKYLAPPRNYPK